MLGNGTEYQHAFDEDANPTSWYKLMSIFQPCKGSNENGNVTGIA